MKINQIDHMGSYDSSGLGKMVQWPILKCSYIRKVEQLGSIM